MTLTSSVVADSGYLPGRVGESAYRVAPEMVKQFCSFNNLIPDVISLANLASQHMEGCQEVYLELQSDPETDNSWIVVEARIGGGGDKVKIEEYKNTLKGWITNSIDGVRDLIKFTFSPA